MRKLLVPILCFAAGFSAAEAASNVARPQVEFPDVRLVDQNGQEFHFYPGMTHGRVLAINTIFTTCTTICPLIGVKVAQLEKELGPRPGKFQMISISVDPATDTPARLREWATRFHAGPEWKLLTGAPRDVEAVLKALGFYVSAKEGHSFAMLVGGEDGWTRTTALLPARDLAALVQSRLKDLH